jgi:hypothetical protein
LNSTEVDLDLQIALDSPLICEIQWWDEKNQREIPCKNEATWVGMCHDEVESHAYQQILFCGKCFMLAKMKNKCPDDGEKLILKARKL